ncbi:MAG: hypothetical protein M3460_17335 [Actinomycetota bacterium]|nr:hypothetical protein [Actinomycetota bacterium]
MAQLAASKNQNLRAEASAPCSPEDGRKTSKIAAWWNDLLSRLQALAWLKAHDEVPEDYKPAGVNSTPKTIVNAALRASTNPEGGTDDQMVNCFAKAWDAVKTEADSDNDAAREFLGLGDRVAIRNRLFCYARDGRQGTELTVVLLSIIYPRSSPSDLTKPFAKEDRTWVPRSRRRLNEDRFKNVRSILGNKLGDKAEKEIVKIPDVQ